jgi:membrane protein
MSANAHQLAIEEPRPVPSLQPASRKPKLKRAMLRFLRLLRLAVWRAFQHDAFSIAKASAYSSILTFFPALLIVGSVLATWSKGAPFMREITYALSRILPTGANTALAFLRSAVQRPFGMLVIACLITLWTASGVMVSWMEGFRRCYELPKIWGLIKERMIAFGLVIFALLPMTFATLLVAFGSKIEADILFYTAREFSPYILMLWAVIRWVIAILTSIVVISLIYHNAVPRTQPWHSVIPGASIATGLWFSATLLFGWYLRHYADYSIIYGSLGAAIALLVWMYMISLVVLVGAEFNAMIFPRAMLGKELTALSVSRTSAT